MSAAPSADVGAEHGNARPAGVKREGPLLPEAPRRWRRGLVGVPGEQAPRGDRERKPEEEILAALEEVTEGHQAAVDHARAQWEWFDGEEVEEGPPESQLGDDPEADEVEVAVWRREGEERAARRAQQRLEQAPGEGVSAVSEGPRAGPKSS